MSAMTSRIDSSPRRIDYNYCTRIQKVIVVLSVMALSAHFAGCDFASLGGCASTSITLYKCAFSVVLYNTVAILFQYAFKSVAWQINLGTSTVAALLVFFYVPLSTFVFIAELERYLALFWLLLQGLILIDIAHDVHLYIIKRAELAYNFRGAQAAKPWYLLHMVLSFSLLLAVVGSSHMLYSQCGQCFENIIAIGVTLSSAVISLLFSLSERFNKGCLIPAIVSCYSMLLCAAALLSNPKTSCNSFPTSSITEYVKLRNVEKATINWLLLLTTVTSMIYASMTGSPSLILLYKCFRSCISRRQFLNSGSSCIVSDFCCALFINETGRVANDSNPLRNREIYSTAGDSGAADRTPVNEELEFSYAQQRRGSQGELLSSRDLGETSRVSNRGSSSANGSSNDTFLVDSSSSGSVGELTGEGTALLRDHHQIIMSSDSDFSPCSSKSADDLINDNAFLFHIQLSLSSSYLAVQLSDWTAIENSLSGIKRNESLEAEAMHMKLIGDYAVWIMYGFVLLNSYLIYIYYNRRLRVLIGV